MRVPPAALLLAALLGAAGIGLPAAQPPVGPAPGDETVAGPIAAWVGEVIDGDTFVVRARIWLGQDVETRVRLLGVDTPELKGRCAEERDRARAARDFVRERIAQKRVSLVDIRHDKYGRRVLAGVITPEGENLAEALIRRGLGRAYDGTRRRSWCGAENP